MESLIKSEEQRRQTSRDKIPLETLETLDRIAARRAEADLKRQMMAQGKSREEIAEIESRIEANRARAEASRASAGSSRASARHQDYKTDKYDPERLNQLGRDKTKPVDRKALLAERASINSAFSLRDATAGSKRPPDQQKMYDDAMRDWEARWAGFNANAELGDPFSAVDAELGRFNKR
jgi:hypothetical protein